VDFAKPGALIADRYRLERPLGAGGSAVVWEAHDTALNRTVAAKLLHGGATDDPVGQERLRREAHALARLAHPRITTVFDYVEQAMDDGTTQPVLITELLRGVTLEERLASGPLPEAEARRVCTQLADALRAAHRAGIVHRDLKPGNVMLTADGAKLFDFGIAQTASDTESTGRLVIGTPACMAPEQLTGRGAVAASDVYALGCVLYWCLTGRPPFAGATVDQVVNGHLQGSPPPLAIPGLPPQIVGLYWQCLAKDPGHRPTAEAVVGGLEQAERPVAHRTLVMPAYEAPGGGGYDIGGPGSGTGAGAGHGGGPGLGYGGGAGPGHGAGSGFGHGAGAAARFAGRRSRVGMLVVGALVIAAVAAGVTALAMHGSNASSGASAGQGVASQTPTVAPTTTTPSPSVSASASASASTPSAPASPTADPATDPIAYLEGMRTQIQALISQGPNTLDPNTGHDLENSIADLENAVTAAQQGGNHTRKLRDVANKISTLNSKISDASNNGTIDQAAAQQLSDELQTLSSAVVQG
jgi:tRNA A-37 threonylcarbamoyl transferase component Bud32